MALTALYGAPPKPCRALGGPTEGAAALRPGGGLHFVLMGREEEGTQERGGCQRQNGTLNTCISNGSEHSELRKETLMLLIDVPKGQNVIRSLKQPPPLGNTG